MIKDVIKLIRVKQWVKNAFVLAPLLFSLRFTEFNYLINAGLAFMAFCFVASTVYVMNDILDRKNEIIYEIHKNDERPIRYFNAEKEIRLATIAKEKQSQEQK